jgi:hypothetical protein
MAFWPSINWCTVFSTTMAVALDAVLAARKGWGMRETAVVVML